MLAEKPSGLFPIFGLPFGVSGAGSWIFKSSPASGDGPKCPNPGLSENSTKSSGPQSTTESTTAVHSSQSAALPLSPTLSTLWQSTNPTTQLQSSKSVSSSQSTTAPSPATAATAPIGWTQSAAPLQSSPSYRAQNLFSALFDPKPAGSSSTPPASGDKPSQNCLTGSQGAKSLFVAPRKTSEACDSGSSGGNGETPWAPGPSAVAAEFAVLSQFNSIKTRAPPTSPGHFAASQRASCNESSCKSPADQHLSRERFEVGSHATLQEYGSLHPSADFPAGTALECYSPLNAETNSECYSAPNADTNGEINLGVEVKKAWDVGSDSGDSDDSDIPLSFSVGGELAGLAGSDVSSSSGSGGSSPERIIVADFPAFRDSFRASLPKEKKNDVGRVFLRSVSDNARVETEGEGREEKHIVRASTLNCPPGGKDIASGADTTKLTAGWGFSPARYDAMVEAKSAQPVLTWHQPVGQPVSKGQVQDVADDVLLQRVSRVLGVVRPAFGSDPVLPPQRVHEVLDALDCEALLERAGRMLEGSRESHEGFQRAVVGLMASQEGMQAAGLKWKAKVGIASMIMADKGYSVPAGGELASSPETPAC